MESSMTSTNLHIGTKQREVDVQVKRDKVRSGREYCAAIIDTVAVFATVEQMKSIIAQLQEGMAEVEAEMDREGGNDG